MPCLVGWVQLELVDFWLFVDLSSWSMNCLLELWKWNSSQMTTPAFWHQFLVDWKTIYFFDLVRGSCFFKNSFDIVYQMFISFTFVYSNLGVCFASFHWGWLLQATLFHTFKRLCCVWWLVPMVSPWIWKQRCCVLWTQRLSCVRRCRCGALLRWNAPGRSGNCYQKWLDSTWWHFETSSDMWHLWILPYNAY